MRSPSPARLCGFWLLVILSSRSLTASSVGQPSGAVAPLAAADRQFADKSYAAALEGYRSVLASGVDLGDRRPEIEYRCAVSLGKAERWDEALAEARAFGRRWPGTIWEARGQYWLGRLLMAVPHEGYRAGSRLYRGSSVPKVEGGERPQPVGLYLEDRKLAVTAFEAAKSGFERSRSESLSGKARGISRSSEASLALLQRRSTREGGFRRYSPSFQRRALRAAAPRALGLLPDEIDLDFDLARMLLGEPLTTWAYRRVWLPPGDPSWRIDPAQAYGPEWPVPKRILFLLRQIQQAGTPHQQALARLAEAFVLDYYHATMKGAALLRWNGRERLRPYPYQELDAERQLRTILTDYPGDPIADSVHYLIGMRREIRDDRVGALALYRELLAARPMSEWANDARHDIAVISRRGLWLDTGAPQPSGRPAPVTLTTRSVRSVLFRAYAVRLEAVVREIDYPRHAGQPLGQLVRQYFERRGTAALGAPVAVWQVTIRDRGDYQPVDETIVTPLKQPGAYLIVAQAPQLLARGLLLITDRALVQKVTGSHALAFVADARTGVPDPAARVIGFEHRTRAKDDTRTRLVEGRTNADGLFEFALSTDGAQPAAPSTAPVEVQMLAWSGNHYAVSSRLQSEFVSSGPFVRIYSYTDRRVYRPGQRVQFRQLVARREGGRVVPWVRQAVVVWVVDPQRNIIFDQKLATDAYGSVSGEFRLPAETALGDYLLLTELAGSEDLFWQRGFSRFRVEEYRKPEFDVTVTPQKGALRVGQRGSAKLLARYYYGAPVPHARVVYRVYRSVAAPRYRFPRRFDFLYHYWDEDEDDDDRSYEGYLVRTGETRTNAAGQADITFETVSSEPRWRRSSLRYTVQAEVTDSSRRTITGWGAVLATRQQFSAFLDTPRGFYLQGDRVPVETVTLGDDKHPVAASGVLRVYRRQWRGERLVETPVYTAPLQTDARGHGKAAWPADRTGLFRIAFEARDAGQARVVGSLTLWVSGAESTASPSLRRGVRLVAESDTVPEGGRARVLLVVDRPGATVLLTHEADGQILRREVMRLSGTTRVLSIPIHASHAPNFYLQATMVRDGAVHSATQELRIPPIRQFARVVVTPDRRAYRPREQATFHLQATDWLGRPVRGAFSIGVTDTSLDAIRKDDTADVRVFFYAMQRSQSIRSDSSVEMKWEVEVVNQQPALEHRRRDWVIPPAWASSTSGRAGRPSTTPKGESGAVKPWAECCQAGAVASGAAASAASAAASAVRASGAACPATGVRARAVTAA